MSYVNVFCTLSYEAPPSLLPHPQQGRGGITMPRIIDYIEETTITNVVFTVLISELKIDHTVCEIKRKVPI